jgi:predicted dehydrogenase
VGEWTEYGYILGTEGQLIFDFLMIQSSENGRIAVWRRSEAGPEGIGWSTIEQPDPDRSIGLAPGGAAKEMFNAQLAEFALAVRGLPNRSPSGLDGTIAVAVTEAAYRSAQSGQTHPVELQKSAAS